MAEVTGFVCGQSLDVWVGGVDMHVHPQGARRSRGSPQAVALHSGLACLQAFESVHSWFTKADNLSKRVTRSHTKHKGMHFELTKSIVTRTRKFTGS